MQLSNETAGICGLFCGTCQAFPQHCGGCLSDRVADHCIKCSHGFRDCAKAHRVTWCWQCETFPCQRLEQFSKEHIVNGICHHAHIIEDLQFMKEHGVEMWVTQQVQQHTCPSCNHLIVWFEQSCPNCKKDI